MITTRKHKQIVWIDLESPTSEEVHWIMEEYGIHSIVAQDLLTPTLKPRVELYDNYIYLVLHFPSLHTKKRQATVTEVDFIICKNTIITTRYGGVDALHKFAKNFEVETLLERSTAGLHSGYIFSRIITEAYDIILNELEGINDTLEATQDKIFNGQEKEMVKQLSDVSRDLLNFTRAINIHKEILTSFEVAGNKFFGEEFAYHIRSIISEYYKIENATKSNRSFLEELRETNNSLLTTKQNEIMKVLTIMAFVTFPLSLLASIFGMNTVNMPFIGYNNDFYIIVGIMALLTGIFFLFFKYKKWL